MELKGKKVTVVGLGNSGINAAMLLDGLSAEVWATDSRDNDDVRRAIKVFGKRAIKTELGGHTKEFISGSDLVVISPGVDDNALPVKWAISEGVPVISEMELGYEFCKGRIIAITGTNGKSTVTKLIGEILKNGGFDTVVCGNIGNSLSGEIPRIKKDTWVVLEVSSFQLEKTIRFKPAVSLILNITDDHLDRYKAFDDYFKEKLKVFANQDKEDALIINHDASNLHSLAETAKAKVFFYSKFDKVNGAYTKDGSLVCPAGGKETVVCSISDIPLKGMHNLENVLASILVGRIAGVAESSIKDTIRGFKGLSHRVEVVDVIDGVEYVDDSKGTTVDSTYRALESSDKPVILIAGGRDKNSNYHAIKGLVKDKVKHLILIGEAAGRIREALGDVVRTYDAPTMLEAVKLAHSLAEKEYMVLLSPMCSSFDMFKDYKHRGDVFKEAVKKIKALE
ncbi:MAG: UDP-N-acetylmuramoyl-L-alanine--D-glutamate ligase [Candidatus Omnitrophota bacterium]|jgi:UDP-N-acetylmuramoylalanine--D-glutamate ligase